MGMNIKLEKNEIAFLEKQEIFIDELYDARGKRLAEWQDHCRQHNIFFIVGNRCQRGGHRLRTRANHCIQCDTRKIAFMRRHYKPSNVYLAWSPSARLCKIGVADDVKRRQRMLRSEAYGGIKDWTAKLAVGTEEAGAIEMRVQARLEPYVVTGEYKKDGRRQAARELFQCDVYEAADALLAECGCRLLQRFSWWSDRRILTMVAEHCVG